MADVLVDTDIFVDHLRGVRPVKRGRDVIHYSLVTRAELFAGRGTEEVVVGHLLAPFREMPSRSVAERAGRLRLGSSIRIADALIAATALEHGLTLVTRDFEAIRGLRLHAFSDARA